MKRTGLSHSKYNEWCQNNPDKTVGWEKTCSCTDHDPVPATILDPFCGAGTTGLVCMQNERRFVGIELNPDYAEIAHERIKSGILPCPRLFV